jgi:DNA-binding transcriptional regulator YdaS (Cro superfamily)
MILHGGRACSPAEAAHIEAVTEGQITRMELLYRHESTNPLLPEI